LQFDVKTYTVDNKFKLPSFKTGEIISY